MEAVDLGSQRQRRFVVALACGYPALWLIGITKMHGSMTLAAWAILPSLAIYLFSALGAFATLRASGSGTPARGWSRFGIFLSWGWLIPYCLISAGAIAAFEYLWPAFGILVLPALLFLASPVAREQLPRVALVCVAIAGLYILLVVDAEMVWKLELSLVLAISAGPFWSLAAYLVLYEHLVHPQPGAERATRGSWAALAFSILGVSIFCMLAFGVMILAMTGY